MAGPSIKRYWPILLMAVAMAERAHAPVLNKSSAAIKKQDSVKPAEKQKNGSHDAEKKSAETMDSPPIPDALDSLEVKKRLEKILQARRSELTLPWELLPPSPAPDPSPSTNTIALVQPTDPTSWSGINGDAGGGGGNQTDPGSTIPAVPPASPSVNGYVIGGTDDLVVVPQAQNDPVKSTDPQVHHTLGVDSVVSVPEPGMLSVLMCGWLLVRRPDRRGN